MSAKRIKKDSRGEALPKPRECCVCADTRGTKPRLARSGAPRTGQRATSPALPLRLTAATVYHIHTTKSSPFCEKIQKDWILYAKSPKKSAKSHKKPAKGGTTDYPLFPPIVSVRFAHLPASQKDGGNVEQYAQAGRTVVVPRKLQRRRRCDHEGAGAGGGHPTPKQGNILAIKQNTIFVQLRWPFFCNPHGVSQPHPQYATTQKYVSILYNCQESAASEAATPRPWCGA